MIQANQRNIDTECGYGLYDSPHVDSPGFNKLWIWWFFRGLKTPLEPQIINLQLVAILNKWGGWQTYNKRTLPNGAHLVGAGLIRLLLANGEEEQFYSFGGCLEYLPDQYICRITSAAPILHLNKDAGALTNYLMTESEKNLRKLANSWGVSEVKLRYCLRHNYAR